MSGSRSKADAGEQQRRERLRGQFEGIMRRIKEGSTEVAFAAFANFCDLEHEQGGKEATCKLAEFIIREIPGEPSRSEGAVECAIRIIREQQKTIEIARVTLDQLLVKLADEDA